MRRVLYLVRHGPAAAPGPRVPDAERNLTDQGRDVVRRQGRVLRLRGVRPDVILCSPYVRAAQTAALMSEVLGLSREPVPRALLTPDSPGEVIAEALLGLSEPHAMAVGHLPSIEETLAALLDGGPAPRFLPGAVAAVELEDGSSIGTLAWFVDPREQTGSARGGD